MTNSTLPVAGSMPVAAGLADDWWYWVLAAAILLGAAAFSGHYRAAAARARAAASRRGLVELPPGLTLDPSPRGFWSDLSWLALAVGLWVMISPWTWGYDGAGGAVTTDVVTGGVVIALTLVAIVFPAVWALHLMAGLWLVTAPWVVGYGDANGPVGLSDSAAGIVLSAVAIMSLAASERALRRGGERAIGRIPPRE